MRADAQEMLTEIQNDLIGQLGGESLRQILAKVERYGDLRASESAQTTGRAAVG